MRAAYLTGPRRIDLLDEPEPRPTADDDVLLRIDRVGVCGSDVHYWAAGGIGSQRVEYPQSIGHEFAGTVLEVGPAVERLRPGDRVAVDPAFVCGRCDQCRVGRQNTCRELRFMGCPGEAPGAMAERRIVPADNCLRIPDDMSLETAVLTEPLSIAIHAVRMSGIFPAARAAILGAGPIGLSVLMCARAQSPCEVVVTDLIDARLAAAERFGAEWTLSARREDVVGAVVEREPLGVDVVFECSGDPACVDQAAQLLVPGGTLIHVGIPTAPSISFDPHVFRRKELTWSHVRRQRGCIAPAIRLIEEGVIEPGPLATHCFPLDDVEEAFELVANYHDGVIKAIVDVSGEA